MLFMALLIPIKSRSSLELTESMMVKIESEFALILYMLSEMPALIATEFILMLIIFAAVI